MCGIFVLSSPRPNGINLEKAEYSLRKLRHRGPDSLNFEVFDEGRLFMGHALLQVRSKNTNCSKQPISCQKNDLTMVFNGEIYNTDDLQERRKYERPSSDKSTSDSEVLINFFSKQGISSISLNQIDGMFALAILDKKNYRLTVARDHAGIKPLYKYVSRDTKITCYSSEIKPILNYFSNEISIDSYKIGEFLRFKYIGGSNTIWGNVYKINPGEMDIVDIRNSRNEAKQRFWYSPNTKQDSDSSIENIFFEDTNAQLMTCFNAGLQLSGGLDSTIMYENVSHKENLNIFSAVFEGHECNEEDYINQVINSRAQNIAFNKLNCDENYFYKDLVDASHYLEEPLSHPHTIAIGMIAQKALKEDIKIMLSGEGADELFAGYAWHENILANKAKINATEFLGVNELKQITSTYNITTSSEARTRLLSDLSSDSKYLQYEVRTHLQNLLIRQDKMMMRYSIENRVPFLSRRLFDIAINTPDKMRYSKYQGKTWIKKSLSKHGYDKSFINRKKVGFRIPYNAWNMKCLNEKLLKHLDNSALLDILSISKNQMKMLLDNNNGVDLFKLLWQLESMSAFMHAFNIN